MHLLLFSTILFIIAARSSPEYSIFSDAPSDLLPLSQDAVIWDEITRSQPEDSSGSKVSLSNDPFTVSNANPFIVSSDDYFGAADVPELDLFPLVSACNSENDEEVIMDNSLWARDEALCAPRNEGSGSILDLFQGPEAWFPILPKKPQTPDSSQTPEPETIKLPPKLSIEDGPCFYPLPVHCCCSGQRGFLRKTAGGLVRVISIEDCEICMCTFKM